MIRRNLRGWRIGSSHQRAKLDEEAVKLIRRLNAEGLGYRVISRKFEAGESTIRDVCTYRTWVHVRP